MTASINTKKSSKPKRGTTARPVPLMYSYYYNARTRNSAPIRQNSKAQTKIYQTNRFGGRLIPLVVIILAIVIGIISYRNSGVSRLAASAKVKGARTVFNKNLNSVTDPASLWVVVNKGKPLPNTFVPVGLRVPAVNLRLPSGDQEMSLAPVAADAVEKLVAAASANGVQLMLGSGYRSILRQKVIYDDSVQKFGQAETDALSAKPGTSEHQTGLAVDFDAISRTCEFQKCFETTPEHNWLAIHAYEYGFILRYTQDKESVTKYSYEPWHYRYVGPELARELYYTNIKTLEEFFSL